MRRQNLLLGVFVAVAIAGVAKVYIWPDVMRTALFSDQSRESGVASMPVVKVVMYSTTWCTVCQQARNYLVQHRIPFTEVDVEKSEAGREEFQRLGGRSVPIILVGNQRMDGFGANRFELLLKRATY